MKIARATLLNDKFSLHVVQRRKPLLDSCQQSIHTINAPCNSITQSTTPPWWACEKSCWCARGRRCKLFKMFDSTESCNIISFINNVELVGRSLLPRRRSFHPTLIYEQLICIMLTALFSTLFSLTAVVVIVVVVLLLTLIFSLRSTMSTSWHAGKWKTFHQCLSRSHFFHSLHFVRLFT